MSEFNYYLVSPGGETAAKISAHLEARKNAYLKRRELNEKYGADGNYATESSITGLVFNNPPDPKIWTYFSEKGGRKIYKPNRRTKLGKQAAQDLASPAYVMPDEWKFHFSMMDELITKPGCILLISYQKIGSNFILVVPIGGDPEGPIFVPGADCRLLKMSEYHKLVEDEDEKGN